MTIDLNRWQSRLVLQAFRALEEKWAAVIENSSAEDIQAEFGNDLTQLQLVRERIEGDVSTEFGSASSQLPHVPAA